MNFTPQTDAQEGQASEWLHNAKVVPAAFARELERQLNTANAKIVELQGNLIRQAANQQTNYTLGIWR
jgi:hypothetical protein